ncbi:MAG: protein TolR [Desulfobulbaceae bacterium]|uniref:Protein TolR n=1 Tax=Candidatus Desulfatifera sulfidica TaxID=2841691 RepID=A0A8J6N644_9BACT|nr:protein TolR [Candidatus Desulfatifera sulfidica]
MGPVRKNNRRGLVAEINVTPLVDVMLVLLIIFMVTAPMMTQGLDVNLPETTSKSLRQKEEPVVVSINREGKILLGKIEVDRAMLHQQLSNMAVSDREQPVFLKADQEVAYGLVVAVMADIKAAGFDKLGMVTRPVEEIRQ